MGAMPYASDSVRLGAAIRHARLSAPRTKGQRAMSQKELGRRCGGLDQATVSKWESGDHEPGISTLRTIARVCGVTVSWLLGERDAA